MLDFWFCRVYNKGTKITKGVKQNEKNRMGKHNFRK